MRRLPNHFCAGFCKEVAEKLDVFQDFEAETGTKMAGKMRVAKCAAFPPQAPNVPSMMRREILDGFRRRIVRYCLNKLLIAYSGRDFRIVTTGVLLFCVLYDKIL